MMDRVLNGQMRAVLLQALNDVAPVETAVPSIGDDKMLIQMQATTLCTSDLHDIVANPYGSPLPLSLGHEATSLAELVTHCLPLDAYAEAIELAAHGQVRAIKVALVREYL